jgi:hypothetical protein
MHAEVVAAPVVEGLDVVVRPVVEVAPVVDDEAVCEEHAPKKTADAHARSTPTGAARGRVPPPPHPDGLATGGRGHPDGLATGGRGGQTGAHASCLRR